MSDEEEEKLVPKKKRTCKTRQWTLLLRLKKGNESGFDSDDEEINHQVYQAAKKIKLATFKPKHTDLHLWKWKVGWGSDRDTQWINIYGCPLETRFGCSCQFRVTNSPMGTVLEMRGSYDA